MQNAKVYSHLRQIAYFCYNLIFHGALPSHIRVSVCNLYHNFVMPIEMQIPSSLFFESIFLLFEIPQSFATHSTYGTRFWKAFFFLERQAWRSMITILGNECQRNNNKFDHLLHISLVVGQCWRTLIILVNALWALFSIKYTYSFFFVFFFLSWTKFVNCCSSCGGMPINTREFPCRKEFQTN